MVSVRLASRKREFFFPTPIYGNVNSIAFMSSVAYVKHYEARPLKIVRYQCANTHALGVVVSTEHC